MMISYVLIYKKECFLANLEEARFDTNTIDPKRKKNRFYKKSQGFEILKIGNNVRGVGPVWYYVSLCGIY